MLPEDVVRDGPFLGALFESLVALGARVDLQRSEARVSHFRMHRGDHEVDLIVERRDGRCVGLEVKLSPIVNDDDVRHLMWLRDKLGPTCSMLRSSRLASTPTGARMVSP